MRMRRLNACMWLMALLLFNGFVGAANLGRLVVDGERKLGLPPDSLNEVGKGKVVCLDYFYNNEWKKTEHGRPFRYHYVWEDTANSGFSELGKTIVNLGAEVDTLSTAPTPENLSQASVYVIV